MTQVTDFIAYVDALKEEGSGIAISYEALTQTLGVNADEFDTFVNVAQLGRRSAIDNVARAFLRRYPNVQLRAGKELDIAVPELKDIIYNYGRSHFPQSGGGHGDDDDDEVASALANRSGGAISDDEDTDEHPLSGGNGRAGYQRVRGRDSPHPSTTAHLATMFNQAKGMPKNMKSFVYFCTVQNNGKPIAGLNPKLLPDYDSARQLTSNLPLDSAAVQIQQLLGGPTTLAFSHAKDIVQLFIIYAHAHENADPDTCPVGDVYLDIQGGATVTGAYHGAATAARMNRPDGQNHMLHGGGGGGGRFVSEKERMEQYRKGHPEAKQHKRRSDNLDFYRGCKPLQLCETAKGLETFYIDDFHSTDAWFRNYERLESCHNYIQWLFPIQEGSGMNSTSRALQKHEIEWMTKDAAVMTRVRRSLDLMLDFYGMMVVDEDVDLPASAVPSIVASSFASHKGDDEEEEVDEDRVRTEEGENDARTTTTRVTRTVYRIQRSDHKTQLGHPSWPIRYGNVQTHSHNNRRITRILKFMGEMGHEDIKIAIVRFIMSEIWAHGELQPLHDALESHWIETIKDDATRDGVKEELKKLKEESNFTPGVSPVVATAAAPCSQTPPGTSHSDPAAEQAASSNAEGSGRGVQFHVKQA